MFVDVAKIYIKAGNGGNGSTHFLRDAHHIAGGPDGGNGGRGGHIYFVADNSMNNLVDFYYKKKYYAQDGEKGSGKNCNGKIGEDLIIKVPRGTVIKDCATGKVVADIIDTEVPVLVLKGGRGGRGNAFFATSTRQTPNFSETGEIVKDYKVTLELKVIADVGLVGLPNVGKSTILMGVSNATPKIANYHFTTLNPNLGVVKYYEHSFIVADIPGLIEGASEGAGLGITFLRHIERTRMLVHVIDISASEGNDPYESFVKINNELANYSSMLSEKKQIIALNKCDLLEDESKIEEFKAKVGPNYPIVTLSAATTSGLDNLIKTIFENLKDIPPVSAVEIDEDFELDKRDYTSINVTRDDDGTFIVSGGKIDELVRCVVLSDTQSFAYFQKRLKNDGIIDMLKEKGAQEGDQIKIKDIIFEMVD